MLSNDQYELLDFGAGRKLERLAGVTVDRPCPAAEDQQPRNKQWQADLVFRRREGTDGAWSGSSPELWQLAADGFQLQLRCTPFGHVGVFPEQADNWQWIQRQVRRAKRPLRVLNLFAYTGGSTLAAAAAGAEVTHVDAAKNIVGWARRNAEQSQLAEAPIRWLHEDAVKFVRRELKRGRQYDAVVLDPPSYGHGAGGEAWRITRDLPPLLEACGQLTRESRAFVLLSCHSSGFGPAELEALLADAMFGSCQAGARATPLRLKDAQGRSLPAGCAARWPGTEL